MRVQLAAVSGCVAHGGLQSELAAFVFTHGYKVELTVSTVWGQDDQDFTLMLSFESLSDRDSFCCAFFSAREQWNNGNSLASSALVPATLDRAQPATTVATVRGEDDTRESLDSVSPSSSLVAVGSVLRVVEAAKVRAHPSLDSEQVGMLLVEERILVLEVVTLSSTVNFYPELSDNQQDTDDDDSQRIGDEDGSDEDHSASTSRSAVVHTRHRVRFHRGWASLRASDGDVLLVPNVHLEPEPEPEPSALSLTGLVTGAATEAIKILSQSEAPNADSAAIGADQHYSPSPLARQTSLPRLNVQSSLFRMDAVPEQAALLKLQRALPALLQALDWTLKYRLSQDGASLSTLLRQSGMSTPLLFVAKVRRPRPNLVVPTRVVPKARWPNYSAIASAGVAALPQVEVAGNGSYLLGGLASRTLSEKVPGTTNEVSTSGKWKGTGQSFIFGMPLPADDGSAPGEDGRLHTWGWTRKSNCFQLAGAREGLALGGGGDFGYGIWFDPQLLVCTSSSCETYGNKSSLLHPAAFADDPQNPEHSTPYPKAVTGAVIEMEVWAFV